MSKPTQEGFLLQLVLALFDDLARNEPARIKMLAVRMRQVANEEEDDSSRLVAEKAADLIEGMVTTYGPG